MQNSIMRYLIVLLFIPVVSACSFYDYSSYGKVAKSRLGPGLATPLELPADAPSIKQRFLSLKASSQSEHRGFDIGVPLRTPVLAASVGVVVQVSLSVLYGNQVMINHGPSRLGFRTQTRYFHLHESIVVSGENVRRGQIIGYSGASGLAGVFPHLHFEVHRLNEAESPIAIRFQNPQLFWVDGVGKITCFDSNRDYDLGSGDLTYPVPCRDTRWQ